jgi:uncharacterized protein YjdB
MSAFRVIMNFISSLGMGVLMKTTRLFATFALGAALIVGVALPAAAIADEAGEDLPATTQVASPATGSAEEELSSLTEDPETDGLADGANAPMAASDDGGEDDGATQQLPVLTYSAHVKDIGWQSAVSYDVANPNASVLAGTTGRGLRMEALNASVAWEGHEGGIDLRSHVQDLGWMSWASGTAGTTGRGLRMEAVELRLTGDIANYYSVYYRVHCSDVGWLDWACDGAAAGTSGQGHAIEAIQIVLVAKDGGELPGSTARPFIGKSESLSGKGVYLSSSSAGSSKDGVVTLGSADSSSQLVSFALSISDKLASGSISYMAYQSFGGWQSDWTAEGKQLAATNGGNAIQAVKMQLSDDLAGKYDLWYRAELADGTWTGWAANGDAAGYAGSGALKAVQVTLVDKGTVAPGDTDNAYNEATYDEPMLSYQAHCSSVGWQAAVSSGEQAGTTGKSLGLEALRVQVLGADSGSVQISGHISNVGWQDYVDGASYAGTVGKSTSIQAVKLRLTDELADSYDIYYRVHAANVGWLGWAKNDEIAGTTGFNNAIEAIEIRLVKHGDDAPSQSAPASLSYTLTGSAHVQDIGWMNEVSGTTITFGTTGMSKRLEAFKLGLDGTASGSISYSAHVSDVGWQSSVTDGDIAGTVGKGKQVECVKLSLTGDAAKYYDIWYRAYVQDYGWLGWASNGSMAGTSGIGYRIESLQVTIRLKGTGAPGSTYRAYTNEPIMPADQLAMYNMAQGYSSPTNWLILVNSSTCRAGVFYGSKGNWSLQKYYTVSPGAASTPTIKGVYSVGTRGYSFGSGYTCYYWTQIHGDYLFHSVLYYQGTFNIMDGRLGQNLSHGCVRMNISEAKWIYDNIPSGTTVVSY